jgi:hypothetical protein
MSQDIAVSTATSFGMKAWGSIPEKRGILSLPPRFQTGSGAHPASYPMFTSDTFTGVNRPARDADHALPTNVEVYTRISTPHKSLWRCAHLSTGPTYLYHVMGVFISVYATIVG